MVQAIGSAAPAGAVAGQLTAASLQAQLVKYQQQLSDCVNCDSSKTPQGKADIQAISAKISDVKARLERVTGVKSPTETGHVTASASAEVRSDRGAVGNTNEHAETGKPVSAAKSTDQNDGTVVDLYV